MALSPKARGRFRLMIDAGAICTIGGPGGLLMSDLDYQCAKEVAVEVLGAGGVGLGY